MDASGSRGDTGGPAYRGELRSAGGAAQPGTITLGKETLTIATDGSAPGTVSYRDLKTIAVGRGVGLMVVGTGSDAEHWLLDRFGAGLGPLVGALRERRLRQLLGDALVEVPEGPIELVEYARPDGTTSGVALLVVHGWGLVVAPVDESIPWIHVRRSRIGAVTERSEIGGIRVDDTAGMPNVDMLRLGPAAARHRRSIEALRDGAALDAGRIVEGLVPDVPHALRARASAGLVDGTPAGPTELGDAWTALEASVLVEPTFAASYAAVVARAGGEGAPRWLAVAPESPGSSTTRAWFFVGMPGNLVALELVSAGAHATYLFRVASRMTWGGGAVAASAEGAGRATTDSPTPGSATPDEAAPDTVAGAPGGATRGATDPDALAACVASLSDALVDARFLREPMALPAARLAAPGARRYRLALAAIPSLADARRRFVARIVHADAASWSAALDDLIAWHDACRDDDAEWPGRAAQEAAVGASEGSDDAGGGSP